MKDKNNNSAEQYLRTYLEIQRWMRIGPAKESDLSKTEKEYLLYLGAYPEIISSQKTLCKILNESPAFVFRTIGSLEKKGYVKVTPDGQDHRASKLELTQEGLKKYHGIKEFLYGNAIQTPIDVDPNSLILNIGLF